MTDTNKKLSFSPLGYYDDITTNNEKEDLIATEAEKQSDRDFE